jgi:hypothetical protein
MVYSHCDYSVISTPIASPILNASMHTSVSASMYTMSLSTIVFNVIVV